ncbi:MAG: peptide ABC transporter substrate-binding protein [Candidatus Eremiobacteraeota bacterium]|nr:peptide ABC transporter substrate-binding protein [Candidatus Eremiobacteraeota bacterium]
MIARPWRLACTLAVVLAGCTHSVSSPGGATTGGHSSIVFNISEDPHTLNPVLAQSDDERQVAHLMFDLLLDVDERGRPIPALATVVPTQHNGGVSADGRTIIYHLRHGVRWHDGAMFSARDVQFTWRAIIDPRNDVQSTRGYDLIESIRAPDPYRVIVRLRSAWPPAVATLFTYGTAPMPILPAHLLAGRPLRRSAFNLHPVGTGPYTFVRWERGNRILLRANPGYFRGSPHVATIVVEEVPDINTSLTMLRSGQLDWTLLSPAQRLALGPAAQLRFVFAPFSGFGAIAFNCRRPPLDDVRMRRAIAMAIDRARLSDGITHGQYRITDSDQPPFSWAFDRSVRLPAYDPAAADHALDELGWIRAADGLRRRGGQVLSLTFTTFPEGDTAVRTAEYVQQMLTQRGIDASIKKVSVAQFYLPRAQAGLLLSGRFDMAYIAWRTGEDPDDSEIVRCDGSANYAGYCSPVADALEERALSAPRTAQRRDLYRRIQQLLARDVPYDFLYAPTYGFAVNRSLEGFSPTPFSPTWNAWRWR